MRANEVATVEVAIVGAAFSGIGMAARLKRRGITNFVLLEKADEVGGIWRDNTYPGCACDVPQQLYSYSFRPARGAAVRYPGQPEILAYLRRTVDAEGLRPHLRCDAAVVEAVYDASGHWTLTTTRGDRYRARHLVWAVGLLHRPYLPDIAGRNIFQGTAFHTARWDHDHDLSGRTVAVIGTGASAVQLVPEIAQRARRVLVYQRTPHWVLPRPPERFGALRTEMFTHAPALQSVYRAVVFLGADLALTPIMTRGWSARPATWLARRHLHRQVADPVLRARLTPGYPLGAKRILLANHWYPALSRDDVDLVTAPIRRITSDGIVAEDGYRSVDTIIWATGFRASEYLVPTRIIGRDGIDLHTVWADGAFAYLGVAVPGFPNMFIHAGPSSFTGHGSNPYIHERQSELAINAIAWQREIGAAAIEIRPEVMHRYQRWLDHALARTVWSTTHSWYRTETGRIVTPWPGSARLFARLARCHPAGLFTPTPNGGPRRASSATTTAATGTQR
ncbi:flavin-containing monooxygenase [Nocardia blacklockiae]|uniref:flavin-containing monooxygenase n=1 Tax=Nocardia blacklockiae TaxID=480036 RepID=UPI001896211F|nr:NAD(P)/FAD-dependent oxidoreductase [Nocardia blacklockiae]MBF6171142.1 NAD(P)/FAD-dependent oxidoreductase [Nocardia blacklockiae]